MFVNGLQRFYQGKIIVNEIKILDDETRYVEVDDRWNLNVKLIVSDIYLPNTNLTKIRYFCQKHKKMYHLVPCQ